MGDLVNELVRAHCRIVPSGPTTGRIICRLCSHGLSDVLRHFREWHPDAYREVNGEAW